MPSNSSTFDRWLTIREAAEYMGVSVSQARRLIPGTIPGASRAGEHGHWRIKASAIDKYMEGRGTP